MVNSLQKGDTSLHSSCPEFDHKLLLFSDVILLAVMCRLAVKGRSQGSLLVREWIRPGGQLERECAGLATDNEAGR